MPIQSTKTTSIPGLPVPSTPDLLAYGISINPTFPAAGVSGNILVSTQPYRANDDGTNPQMVGGRQTKMLGDFAAFVAANPTMAANLVAAKTALDAVVQQIVTGMGL